MAEKHEGMELEAAFHGEVRNPNSSHGGFRHGEPRYRKRTPSRPEWRDEARGGGSARSDRDGEEGGAGQVRWITILGEGVDVAQVLFFVLNCFGFLL